MTEEPIAERRVPNVGIVQGIDPVRLNPLSGRDGLIEPAVVRLARELQDPTRNRDGDTASASPLTSG